MDDAPASLPARRESPAGSALTGAAITGLPLSAGLAGILALSPSILGMAALLGALIPFAPAYYLSLALTSGLTAAAMVPVVATLSWYSRRRAQAARSLGRATAAGAGMAATAVSLAGLGWGLVAGWKLAFLATWGAMSVAVIGGLGLAAFAAIPREERARDRLPVLYQTFGVAALGIPAFYLSIAALLAVGFVPSLLLYKLLPPALAHLIGVGTNVALLAPVTYAIASVLGRRYPELSPRAVAGGLVLATAVAFLPLLVGPGQAYPPLGEFLLQALGVLGAGGVHLAAAAIALAGPAAELPRLPGSATSTTASGDSRTG